MIPATSDEVLSSPMNANLADFLAFRPKFQIYKPFGRERVIRCTSYAAGSEGALTIYMDLRKSVVTSVRFEGNYMQKNGIKEAFRDNLNSHSPEFLIFNAPVPLESFLNASCMPAEPRLVGFWSYSPKNLPTTQHEYPRTQVMTWYIQ